MPVILHGDGLQKLYAGTAGRGQVSRSTYRTTGQYDEAGNALWHEGELLVESVYRFKGQSAPVVVLCEVDFEELTPVNARKLFVGMTRGQVRVEVVLSEKAAIVLQGQVFENNRIAK